MKCSKCGYDIYEGTTCPLCGHENGKNTISQPINNGDTGYVPNHESEIAIESQYPMKWYKFLIYFALWAGAVVNIISSFECFNGMFYTTLSESYYASAIDKLYEALPSLKSVEMAYGIGCIALGIFGFIVWYSMKKFKRNGPKLLTVLYVVSIVVEVAFIIAYFSILNGCETKVFWGGSYVSGMYEYQAYLDLNEIDVSTLFPSMIGSVIGSIVMIVANHIYFKNRSDLFIN